MNAEKYCEKISDFIPYANQLYPLGWVFEQDGATPHTSSWTQEFLSDKNVHVLQSPPNSPDLWTMKIVWEIFRHNVEKKNQKVWTSCEVMSGNVESC